MYRRICFSGWILISFFSSYSHPSAITAFFAEEQNKAVSDQVLREIPPDAAMILPFAEQVRKNQQGFWEATLMLGIDMIHIPEGEFLMGSFQQEEGREPGEGPVHRVFIKGIWIGKFEVTREIWNAVMDDGPSPSERRNFPKTDVSYDDIQKFFRAIQIKSGLKFRLPTEAEWEKCGRGGNPAPPSGNLSEIAWHAGNSGGQAHPVGTKKPNGYGLYDMLGNVWEWCSDWHGESYYAVSPILNPSGPTKGKRRIGRGGGFNHGGNYLRIAHRNDNLPSSRKPYLGFRLVLDTIPAGR